MARKTKEEAEKTRIRILDTALELFYEKGYSRCTLVDIANRIGLTKGAIYWHFKSKVDLFLGLGQYMEEKLETELAEFYTRSSGITAIRSLPAEMIRRICENRQLNQYYTLIYYRMEWRDELLPVKDFFEKQDQLFRQYAEGLFSEAQVNGDIGKEHPVSPTASAWLALVDGFTARALLEKDGVDELLADLEIGLNIYISGLNS